MMGRPKAYSHILIYSETGSFFSLGNSEGKNGGKPGEICGERCKYDLLLSASSSGFGFMLRRLMRVMSLCEPCLKPKLPLLLSRMNEVSKVFLATNSDYKYTDVSFQIAHSCLNTLAHAYINVKEFTYPEGAFGLTVPGTFWKKLPPGELPWELCTFKGLFCILPASRTA